MYRIINLVFLPAIAGSQEDIITYGSGIKLASLSNSNFLNSIDVQWNGRPQGQNIVTTVNDDSSSQIYWTLVHPAGQAFIPTGTPVKCGSSVRFQHTVSSKFLYANGQFKSGLTGQTEVCAHTSSLSSNDESDNFIVECQQGDEVWKMKSKVALKHVQTGNHLSSNIEYSTQNCPGCPMVGQREVAVSTLDRNSWWSVQGGVIMTIRPTDETANEDEDDSKSQREEL